MTRQRWAAAVLACGLFAAVLPAADTPKEPPKDTPAADFTRTKKLKGKVTSEFKNTPLKEILKDISGQLEDLKLGPISADYEQGVSWSVAPMKTGRRVSSKLSLIPGRESARAKYCPRRSPEKIPVGSAR